MPTVAEEFCCVTCVEWEACGVRNLVQVFLN